MLCCSLLWVLDSIQNIWIQHSKNTCSNDSFMHSDQHESQTTKKTLSFHVRRNLECRVRRRWKKQPLPFSLYMFEFFPKWKGFIPDLGIETVKWTPTYVAGERNPRGTALCPFLSEGKVVLVIYLLQQETTTFSIRHMSPHFTKECWVLISRENVLAILSW